MKKPRSINRNRNPDLAVNYRKTVLENGVRVVTEEIPSAESFSLGFMVGAGSRDDSPDAAGAAHFVEHASFRRTSSRTSRGIADRFESVGAYANAYTTKETTCYYARAMKNRFSGIFNALSDIILRPVFKKRDVDKERSIILEEIKSYDDDPEESIFEDADRLLFGDNPISRSIAGDAESVQSITENDLIDFHKNYYSSNNLIVAFAGSIEHDRIVGKVENAFGDLRRGAEVSRVVPEIIPSSKVKFDKNFQQSHILFARRLPALKPIEKYPYALLISILGDGMSSRLNWRIREKYGLTYSIYSSAEYFSDCGAAYVYADCDSKNLNLVEELIREELLNLKKKPINKSEFARAKEQLKSGSIISMENLSTRMQTLAKDELESGERENVRSMIERIDSARLDSVNEIVEEIYAGDDRSVVIYDS